MQVGHINLRGDSGDARFVAGVEVALRQGLPVVPNTLSAGDHRVYWLGPDEWQVVTELGNVAGLQRRLKGELEGQHVAINDLSGGQVTLHLAGPGIAGRLATGCTLDLHPSVFGPGACAQTGLAKAIVLLGCIGDQPLYELTVRRSFADYLLRWLRHTRLEYTGRSAALR